VDGGDGAKWLILTIQMGLSLKTDDEQFTLTTKIHCISSLKQYRHTQNTTGH